MIRVLILTFSLAISFSAYAQNQFHYVLSRPDQLDTLPAILTEISGLTDLNDHQIACVQDELGTIFIYDLNKRSIIQEIPFDEPGDYEGLTRVGKSYFILRSDGRLTKLSADKKSSSIQLPLKTANNEGLCYDPFANRLLIAAKSKPINHDESAKRLIYAFDIAKNTFSEQPVYRVDVAALSASLSKFGLEYLQSQTTPQGKTKPFNFRPSSLAVHPFTKHIYIISAIDRLLVVIDRQGKIKTIRSLEQEMFSKPEGITFFDNGSMVITNEADGGQPTLLLYKYRKD